MARWLGVALHLFWLPQVIHNVRTGARRPLSVYVIGIGSGSGSGPSATGDQLTVRGHGGGACPADCTLSAFQRCACTFPCVSCAWEGGVDAWTLRLMRRPLRAAGVARCRFFALPEQHWRSRAGSDDRPPARAGHGGAGRHARAAGPLWAALLPRRNGSFQCRVCVHGCVCSRVQGPIDVGCVGCVGWVSLISTKCPSSTTTSASHRQRRCHARTPREAGQRRRQQEQQLPRKR